MKNLKFWVMIIFLFYFGTKVKSQQALPGYTGLIMVPTAEIPEDGTLFLGAGYVPANYSILEPKENGELSYYANLTFLPFLELIVGATLPDNSAGSWGIGDRKGIIRIRILSEKKYLPSILLGFHDPLNAIKLVHGNGSTQNFNANYIVFSKNLRPFEKTEIASHLGYGLSLTESRNQQLVGLFGGISIRQGKYLTILFEHDTNKFNGGLRLNLFEKIYLTGTFLGLKAFTGALSVKLKL